MDNNEENQVNMSRRSTEKRAETPATPTTPAEEIVHDAPHVESREVRPPSPLISGLWVTEADGKVRPATAEETDAYRKAISPQSF